MRTFLPLPATAMLCLALAFSAPVSAQHQHTDRCGYVQAVEQRNEQYPGYLEAVNRTFEEAKLRGQANREAGRMEVYTIPVVIHIVHVTSNASQNLDISIIEDQMAIMNEHFRNLNADAGNIRPEFADIVGDAMIQFELVEVKRVGTSAPIFDIINLTYDGIKHASEGGSDAVDPEHNLNIWVAELFPGFVLGYAYPPAGAPNWPGGSSAPTLSDDGVLIDYRAFGSNNPASSFYENQGIVIEGRTTVHEVGHYLGLRHIWGDGDCTADDGIDDTPRMAENSQNSGCVATNNTCGAGETGDLPDMWENYMDYSTETCQIAFTNDQIDVMRAMLEGPRSGLLEGEQCSAPQTGAISGSTDVDEATTEGYSAPSTSNSYSWTVAGGTIVSGQGTNAIQVSWGAGPTGEVCLTESDGACTGNEVCRNVSITAACSTPSTGSISGSTEVPVNTTETYFIPTTPNSIVWTATGGTIVSGQGTKTVDVNWGNGTSGNVCVTESDGACTGNTVCKNVTLTTISGIAEIAYSKGLSVYPNPASSFIRVAATEVPVKIELINVLGAVVATYENLELLNQLPVAHLSERMLLVKVSFEDGFALERVLVY